MRKLNLSFMAAIFLMVIIFNSYSSGLDISVGGNISSPAAGLYQINDRISDFLMNKPDAQDNLKKEIEKLQANVRYGIYGQLGLKITDFLALGGELLLNFNTFSHVMRDTKSGDMKMARFYATGIFTRFYTKFDFLVGTITLLTGPQVNFLNCSAGSAANKIWSTWDLGARLALGWLMVEGIYAFDIHTKMSSGFMLGVGIEVNII